MRRLDRFAVPVALAALALAWPLLDLIGTNAEFFLSRRAPRSDVVVFGLVIGLGIPLIAGLIGLVPRRVGGRWVWLTLVGLMAAILVRLFLRQIPIPDPIITLIALAAGVAAVWALTRFEAARVWGRYLIVTPILVTGLFFFSTPTGAIVRGGGEVLGTSRPPASAHPVILIGFDEFPAATLMTADGRLDTVHFPNFARLAADGTWFRNAVGVEQQTEQAYPAILTGVVPTRDVAPFAGEFPNTIFTLLSDDYQEHVVESVTRLCPEVVCGTPPPPAPAGQRAEVLIRDTAVVSGHLFLPTAVSDGLPSIDGTWGDFGGNDPNTYDIIAAFRKDFANDRRKRVQELLDDINGTDTSGKPPFYFLHVLSPHHPWEFLPTGQRYPLNVEKAPGTTRTGWNDDQWLIDQGVQRHMLSAGYSDYALGQIIDALQAKGLYDDAVIVVLADHGIAVKTNVFHQRIITPDTIGEIAAVPLFVKGPGMAAGKIDDRRAETVDVLPTIADLIGVDIPWKTDGVSLAGPPADRTESTMRGPEGSVTFGVDGHEVLDTAARLHTSFPNGDPYELRPPGAPDLRGVTIEGIPDSGLSWTLDRPEWYQDVDPTGDVVPARITGRFSGDGTEIMAVAINGVIQSVIRGYVDDNGATRFQAMVPPESFRPGANDVSLVLVDGSDLSLIKRY